MFVRSKTKADSISQALIKGVKGIDLGRRIKAACRGRKLAASIILAQHKR